MIEFSSGGEYEAKISNVGFMRGALFSFVYVDITTSKQFPG